MAEISLIAAISSNWVIGNKGKLPWHIEEDLKYFHNKTNGKYVIVGGNTFRNTSRKIWEDKKVLILSNDKKLDLPVFNIRRFDSAYVLREYLNKINEEVFVVGGEQLYKLFLPYAKNIYLTTVFAVVEGDARFPFFDTRKWIRSMNIQGQGKNPKYSFNKFVRNA